MKIIDCKWELKNINKKTIEITIDRGDDFDNDMLSQHTHNFEYAVVKVPMNMPSFNIGLAEMGYICIETQMNVGISMTDFDFSKVAHLYDDTRYEFVENHQDYLSVISNIEPGMFSTDRVCIDPHFNGEIGCRRYINWLTTEYESKKSQLVKVIYQDKHVGFMLIRSGNGTIDLLLNGLYKPYQGKGLGILTPASPMMFIKKNSLPIENEITSISSNNIPVVKLYNRLNFKLIQQTYVFVKHFV